MAQESEVETFRRYILSEGDAIFGCLEGLTEAEVNWRPPAEGTNSLYVLGSHILGNLNQHVLGIACGQQVTRDRDAEFAASGRSGDELIRRWQELRPKLDAALAQLPDSDLPRERPGQTGNMISGRETLLNVIRHAGEHHGHAELTRDLLVAARQKAG